MKGSRKGGHANDLRAVRQHGRLFEDLRYLENEHLNLDRGVLTVDREQLGYDELLSLYNKVQCDNGQLRDLQITSCLVVDVEKEHHQLMKVLHNMVLAASTSLENINFERSFVTGRVFFLGREAKVYEDEQVSIEGHSEDNKPIVRDDDPPLQVEQENVIYQYIKTFATDSSEFRRYYVVLNWLSRVTHVNMARTPISGYGVTALVAATGSSLRTLNIAACKGLDDRALHSIVELCKSLENVDISECPEVSSHGLLHLADLPMRQIGCIKQLDVTGTGFLAEDPREILHLALFRALRSRNFEGKLICDGYGKEAAATISVKRISAPLSTTKLMESSAEWMDLLAEEQKASDVGSRGGEKAVTEDDLSDAESPLSAIQDKPQGEAHIPSLSVAQSSFCEEKKGENMAQNKGGCIGDVKRNKVHGEAETRAREFWKELKFRPISADYPSTSGAPTQRIVDLAMRVITQEAVGSSGRSLDLSQRLINDEVLEKVLVKLGPGLTSLDISGTYLTEIGFSSLRHCPGLRCLRMCNLKNITKKQRANRSLMPHLANMSRLEMLEISGTRISGRALSDHPNLKLKFLAAHRCPISVHALSMLNDHSGDCLESLSLAGCRYLNKDCLEILGLMENLRNLSLANCQGLCGQELLKFKRAKWRQMKTLDITGIRGVNRLIISNLHASFRRHHIDVHIAWQRRDSTSSTRRLKSESFSNFGNLRLGKREEKISKIRPLEKAISMPGTIEDDGKLRQAKASGQLPEEAMGGNEFESCPYVPVHKVCCIETSNSHTIPPKTSLEYQGVPSTICTGGNVRCPSRVPQAPGINDEKRKLSLEGHNRPQKKNMSCRDTASDHHADPYTMLQKPDFKGSFSYPSRLAGNREGCTEGVNGEALEEIRSPQVKTATPKASNYVSLTQGDFKS